MGVSSMTTSLFVVVAAITWISSLSAFQKGSVSSDLSGRCAYYCQFGFMPGVCNCDVVFGLPVAKETPCMLTKCGAKEKCVMVRDQPVCVSDSTPSPTDTRASEPIIQLCQEPKLIGLCHDVIKRFYFNVKKGVCEQFTFSGCGGNLNNFQTISVCQAACGGKEQDKNFETVYRAPGI